MEPGRSFPGPCSTPCSNTFIHSDFRTTTSYTIHVPYPSDPLLRSPGAYSDGGYIGIYTPQNQSTLQIFTSCFVHMYGTYVLILKLEWLVKIYTPKWIPRYAPGLNTHFLVWVIVTSPSLWRQHYSYVLTINIDSMYPHTNQRDWNRGTRLSASTRQGRRQQRNGNST